MRVYEELFPNGLGSMNPDLFAVVSSICALADEVREYRVYRQQRDQQIDEENARIDQQQEQDQIDREARSQKAMEMMKVGSQILSSLPTFPLAHPVMTTPICADCGHAVASHDTNGCIVCDCKTRLSKEVRP